MEWWRDNHPFPRSHQYRHLPDADILRKFLGQPCFYNSYLPDLVPEHLRDRISARGYTWGYIGSVILQVLCFIVVFMPDTFGFNNWYDRNFMPPRVSFILVGLWWLIFGYIAIHRLPISSIKERHEKKNVFTNGFLELKKCGRR
jgi:Permeases of the major facilitator superfamily